LAGLYSQLDDTTVPAVKLNRTEEKTMPDADTDRDQVMASRSGCPGDRAITPKQNGRGVRRAVVRLFWRLRTHVFLHDSFTQALNKRAVIHNLEGTESEI
jgi:hypothetical protein